MLVYRMKLLLTKFSSSFINFTLVRLIKRSFVPMISRFIDTTCYRVFRANKTPTYSDDVEIVTIASMGG